MPVPKLAALAVAACAVASAITSCSGNLATSPTATTADGGPSADAGLDVDAGPVGAPPTSALRQVSLAMSRVNFGDSPTADAWKQIGFNLDGKVTTATSTDVCALVPGANAAEQDDGQDGIDNSFGENICPILDMLDESGPCSTGISQTYVVTDASGSGTVTIQLSPLFSWTIPITDAHVVLNGDGSGMLGAVTATVGLINALDEASAAVNRCFMAGGQPGQSILMQFEQASDFLSDGSNSAGHQCDAISIGMQFWDATPFDGVLPIPDACPTD
jgi:hypothetical protein